MANKATITAHELRDGYGLRKELLALLDRMADSESETQELAHYLNLNYPEQKILTASHVLGLARTLLLDEVRILNNRLGLSVIDGTLYTQKETDERIAALQKEQEEARLPTPVEYKEFITKRAAALVNALTKAGHNNGGARLQNWLLRKTGVESLKQIPFSKWQRILTRLEALHVCSLYQLLNGDDRYYPETC